jgi:hypothetical protein
MMKSPIFTASSMPRPCIKGLCGLVKVPNSIKISYRAHVKASVPAA